MTLPPARFCAASAVAAAGIAALAAPASAAAADPFFVDNTISVENGLPFQCHGVEGVLWGTAVVHVTPRVTKDGVEVVNVLLREKDAHFTTDEGDTYPVRGAIIEKAISGEPPGPLGDTFLFRRSNLVVIGPNGILGAMHERYNTDSLVVHGGCDWVGPVPNR